VTDYNSRTKRDRNTKLQMHSEMDAHYEWRVTLTCSIVCLPH